MAGIYCDCSGTVTSLSFVTARPGMFRLALRAAPFGFGNGPAAHCVVILDSFPSPKRTWAGSWLL